MRKAAAAHRVGIGFADCALVAGGECRRNRARAAAKTAVDMRGQALPERTFALARLCDKHRAKGGAGRANAVKPCAPCKIIAAGKRRMLRRHKPRFHRHDSPRAQAGGCIFLADIDAEAWRQVGAGDWRHHHPHPFARGQYIDPLDLGGKARHHRAFQHRRCHPHAFAPDEAASARQQQAADQQRPPPARTLPCQRAKGRETTRDQHKARPHCGVGEQEPCGNPSAQHYRRP